MMGLVLLMLFAGVGSGTFSIVAVDTATGEFGVAVASRVLDVSYGVPWLEAGVGAAASQAYANPYLGKWALEELAGGKSAEEVLNIVIARDSTPDLRQLGIVDRTGQAAAYTGKSTLEWAGHNTAHGVSIQGNILAGPEVIDAMLKTFQETRGILPERLMKALEAGEAAGGDRRGKQSAALYVVRKRGGYQGADDRLLELKVVDNEEPVKELRRQYELSKYVFLGPTYIRLADEGKSSADLFMARAHELLVSALSSSITDAEVYNALAWEFALRKAYPDETIEAAEKAHELNPEDPNIMDTVAEAYYAAGKYRKAVRWEREALKLEPNNAFFKGQLKKFKAAR